MIGTACHCGAVRFEISQAPSWVLDCNCTLCRRHAALWSYYRGADAAKLLAMPEPGTTDVYSWLDHDIGLHRCKICGCVTHIEALKYDPPAIFGVNMRMMTGGLDPASVRVRQVDNGHTGWFWTTSDTPPEVSRHPPIPRPGPLDWR